MDHNGAALSDQRVASARCELAGRIAALECKVSTTVTDATETVRTATAALRDGVQSAYETATQQVRAALDVRQRVRDHPWTSLGGCTAVGFMAGFLPNRQKSAAANTSAVASSPGPFRTLMDVLKRELVALGESAIVTASTAIRNNVAAGVEPQCRIPADETSA